MIVYNFYETSQNIATSFRYIKAKILVENLCVDRDVGF